MGRQVAHKIIRENKKLFQPYLVNVTLTKYSIAKKGNPNRTCLTRDGIVGLLMKISYKRLPADNRKLVYNTGIADFVDILPKELMEMINEIIFYCQKSLWRY